VIARFVQHASRAAFLAVVLVWAGLVPAQADAPKPVIEKAVKGQQCVEDTDYMRKNHMKVLDHHRDKTVIEGIRTKKHSLKECINCHASEKTGSVAKSKDDFCVSCHSYAAVKIDCFECHSTKPQGPMTMHPLNAANAHYKHKLAAGANKPVSVDEMARVAQ
jgi:hypothetical protein